MADSSSNSSSVDWRRNPIQSAAAPGCRIFETPESLVGTNDSNGSQVKIWMQNRRLFRGDNEFYPIKGEKYYIPASGTIMKFRRDESGKVDAILVPGDDDEVVIPKQTH